MYRTLIELFEDSHQRYAALPHFGHKVGGVWQWVSYAEFHTQVAELRRGLAELGLVSGQRIAIISDNRLEWALTAFAAQGLGAAIVPMYEAQHEHEWAYILSDCGATMTVCASAKIVARLSPALPKLPNLKHVIVMNPSDDRATEVRANDIPPNTLLFSDLLAKGKEKGGLAAVDVAPELPAGLIYTSGTTGNPKGVILTHHNLASDVSAIKAALSIDPHDRTLSFLPWAHVFGQTCELYTMTSFGVSMALCESVDKLLANLVEVRPTLLISVPRIFNRIYEAVNKRMEDEGGAKKALFKAALNNERKRREAHAKGRHDLVADVLHRVFDRLVFAKVRDRFGGKLRFAVSGGAAISKQVAEFIDLLGISVLEGYGLTETAPVIAVNRFEKRRLGSVGLVLPGQRVVIDGDGSEPGEIIAYGPNVMRGYWQLEEENKKVFTADGGFRTGDLGYIDAEGFLYVTGRIKEQYKLANGKYVAPGPLEDDLKLSPYVANAMIYGANQSFNVALLAINETRAKEWAEAHGKRFEQLMQDSEFLAFMKAQVDAQSAHWKGFERVQKVLLTAEDFTNQNGLLTPKLSVKRRAVMEKYGSGLMALYEGSIAA